MSAYKLKITLEGSEPKISRTVAVPKDISFIDLHNIIQTVMGWEDYHAHKFNVNSVTIGEPNDAYNSSLDECKVKLSEYEGEKIRYIYDFGDYWKHLIVFQKDVEGYDKDYPTVLKFANRAPPEDCGGIHGFYGKLEVLNNPKDQNYKSLKEWWDMVDTPMNSDVELINETLEGWTRESPNGYLDLDLVDELLEAFTDDGLDDAYLDRETMEVFYVDAGEDPGCEAILVRKEGETILFDVASKMFGSVLKKMGVKKLTLINWKSFWSKLSDEDRGALVRRVEDEATPLVIGWAEANGYKVRMVKTDSMFEMFL